MIWVGLGIGVVVGFALGVSAVMWLLSTAGPDF